MAGCFTSQLPYYEQHNQLLNDGLTLTDVDLRGAAVPIPDYPGYAADPATIPGVPAGAPIPPSYVNVIGTDFRVPLTWKASVAYQHQFSKWLTLTGTLLGAWTSSNYYYVDENLVADPAFTLSNEANRPVFVPASTITALGVTNNRNARQVASIGRVLGLTNVGSGHDLSAIIEATIMPTSKSLLQVSYTRNNSEDNTTFGCCLARTATSFTAIKGDPRDISTSWGPSDLAFADKLVIAGSLPPVVGFVLSLRYVGISGRPISAVINGDINGDEVNGNDLAFIFDPDDPSTPGDVAAGMRTVLDNPDNVAREYLQKNLGQIASRNGGECAMELAGGPAPGQVVPHLQGAGHRVHRRRVQLPQPAELRLGRPVPASHRDLDPEPGAAAAAIAQRGRVRPGNAALSLHGEPELRGTAEAGRSVHDPAGRTVHLLGVVSRES